MAFDITKPDGNEATWPLYDGEIRENFRAIVQGDAGVFSKMWITATPSAKLVEEVSSTQLAKTRWMGIGQNVSGGWMQAVSSVNADYTGTWSRDDTTVSAWQLGLFSSGSLDAFQINRAAAGANPIAWTALLTLDANGNLGLGGAPTTARAYITNASATVPTVTLQNTNTTAGAIGLRFLNYGATGGGNCGITVDGGNSTYFGILADAGVYFRLAIGGSDAFVMSASRAATFTAPAATATAHTFGGTTTAYHALALTNTGATMNVGIENSAGGGLLTGSTAYAGIIKVATNTPLHFATNSTLWATLGTAGIFTYWNGQTTAGQGVAPILASVALTGQTTTIADTNLLASVPAGRYRVHAYGVTSTANVAGTLFCNIKWNDGVQAQTDSSCNWTASSLGSKSGATIYFHASATTNITYGVTITGQSGTPTYSLYITLERIA